MKLLLYNDYGYLKPMYDDDFEEKRKLKLGKVYEANIKQARNFEFHKKYFKLINIAWELLGEKTHNFFKNSENFRKAVEVAAGNFEMLYLISKNEWVQQAKSIAFDKMSKEEFEELYERVKDVIWSLLEQRNLTTKENFERYLNGF